MKVRFGIMGPGLIARKFADAVLNCENSELYGIASRDYDKAKTFADKYGAKVAYGSYEEMVNDKNIDVVYIATVNSTHIALSKMAIEHGKAVMCEKPMAVSLSECIELVEFAREKNVLLMEAMWSRFLPSYVTAKKWFDEGRIGTPHFMNASYSFKSKFNPENRKFDLLQGGGALFDVGCYPISAVLDFCGGKPHILKGVTRFGETGVDDMGAAIMLYENGMISNVTFGFRAKTDYDAYVHGLKGKIVLKNFWACNAACLYNEKGEIVEQVETSKDVNTFTYEVEHMANLFIEGKKESDIMSLQDSIDSMSVMEELYNEFQFNKHQYNSIKASNVYEVE